VLLLFIIYVECCCVHWFLINVGDFVRCTLPDEKKVYKIIKLSMLFEVEDQGTTENKSLLPTLSPEAPWSWWRNDDNNNNE